MTTPAIVYIISTLVFLGYIWTKSDNDARGLLTGWMICGMVSLYMLGA